VALPGRHVDTASAPVRPYDQSGLGGQRLSERRVGDEHGRAEARTAVGAPLTDLHLLTYDPHALELAARLLNVTFNLHEAPDRSDRDRRGD